MGKIHQGPKHLMDVRERPESLDSEQMGKELLSLRSLLSAQEKALAILPKEKIVLQEVLVEVPGPERLVVEYVDVIKEILVEKEVQVIKEVFIDKLVPYETIVIKRVEVPVDRIIEKEVQVIKEFPVVMEKIVKEFIEVPKEVLKEVEKIIIKAHVPFWAYAIMAIEALAIIGLIIK